MNSHFFIIIIFIYLHVNNHSFSTINHFSVYQIQDSWNFPHLEKPHCFLFFCFFSKMVNNAKTAKRENIQLLIILWFWLLHILWSCNCWRIEAVVHVQLHEFRIILFAMFCQSNNCYSLIFAISDNTFVICHLFSVPVTEIKHWWMLSIGQEVLCEGTSFLLGLAVLFASYYNFNLQY